MKTFLNVIAVGVVVAMLLVVCVGSASADCPSGSIADWDGSDDNLWTTDENWVDDLEPSFTRDDVCLHLDDGDDICEYDTFLGTIGWDITIFGDFPTFFTFNVKKRIHPDSFDLQGYSSLDIDECVEVVGTTDISNRVTIDVGTTPTGSVECCLGSAVVEDESATVDLTGQIKLESLTVSADGASQDISLTLDQGGTVLVDDIWIRAETATTQTARRAALYVKDASITANTLNLWGGQASDRKVGLDLDESVTVRNKTKLTVFPGQSGDGGGHVTIDVAIGVTLDTGELYIGANTLLKVTGIGLNDVFGKVVSSTNEEAAANTCSCP